MKKIGILLLLAVVTISLSSCILSENPLGDKADAIVDANLPGIWYAKAKDDPSTENYLVISQGPDGGYSIYGFSQNEGLTNEEYRGYLSNIGNDSYMNLQFVSGGVIEKDYIIAQYEINKKGELVISLLSTDFFSKAIKDGVLKGRIPEKGTISTLTDSTENLISFIGKNRKEEYLDDEDTITLRSLRKW